MRSRVCNRQKVRKGPRGLLYPQAEARRRQRRAANVNRRRWIDRSLYFLKQAQAIGDWLYMFGHLDREGVSADIAGHVQAEWRRSDRMTERAEECATEAQRWEAAKPV